MRLPGVWLYGALSIGLLATAGFSYGEKWVLVLAILAAGAAYAAEFIAQEMECGRHWSGFAPSLQLGLVASAVSCWALGFWLFVF